MKCPTDDHPQAHLQHNATLPVWHRFLSSCIPLEETVEVIQIAAIPPFLAYDGLNNNLKANEMYERLLSLNDQTPDW
eukprot:1769081-Ditylum_brightwellii.AAC.1